MEIESPNNGDRGWRDSRWLVLVEFALVVGIYVARRHHILKVSATPYLFLLAWISLRLRRVQWTQIGFTRYRTWATTLVLGVSYGVHLDCCSLWRRARLSWLPDESHSRSRPRHAHRMDCEFIPD